MISDEKYRKYIFMKLEEIRGRLSCLSEIISDMDVLELIEEEVFDSEDELDCPMEYFEEIIDQIFTKLRCRLGVLQPLIDDDKINEIMVNGPDNVFIERDGKLSRHNIAFDSVEELEEIIRNIAAGVHREINEMNPIVDARLPSGSRVNGVYKNVAINGPILTIRKFRKKNISMSQLVQYGTLTRECACFLETLVRCGYNIFVSGGTSSGKTTFLNALSEYIPRGERVVVIEDSAELKMDHIENLVQMECHNANAMGQGSVTMDMLIRTSLRMRPDRIIVGEVRGKEVAQMLDAMNTGHDGSFSTGHGNSVYGMLRRLEAMYRMSVDIPMDAIRAQIVEGMDIIIHLGRMSDGTRKVVEIAEIIDYEKEKYIINPLFKLNDQMILSYTGNPIKTRDKLRLRGNEDDLRL
ncbi:MAG: CpaF family protein [Anaerovoracaceae bacterium]